MKPISDVYPDAGEYGYFGVYDYGPLIESIGHEVLVKVDDDDYQGDSNVLFRRADGAFGYLNFGWGSCSGCDALQACDSYEDLESLRNSLVAGIHLPSRRATAHVAHISFLHFALFAFALDFVSRLSPHLEHTLTDMGVAPATCASFGTCLAVVADYIKGASR